MNRFVFLVVLILALAGCRNAVDTGSADVEIALAPEALAVGETVMVVTLTDAAGQPVTAQKVEVRGDMNHAGMVPVIAESSEGEGGVYRLPFTWSMGGDWVVTVTVTLAGGETGSRTFEYAVRG